MKVKSLVLVALFAALTALGALVQIPMVPVQITLQLLFCILAGMLLGPGPGALSQLVYVVLGLIGLPIFAGGGGMGYVLKPSFGYLIGFIAGAFVCGLIISRFKKLTFLKALLAGLACVFTVYIIGTPYLYWMVNLNAPGAMTAGKALMAGFLVFLPGDILKSLLAALAAVKLRPILLKNKTA
jgi:biotin transport system substrate-specific component